MARQTRSTPPDLLAPDPLDLASEVSYPQILAKAGAYREPGRGVMHKLPVGPAYRQGNRWMQTQKAYPVAMSAEEARELTRQTGERHDYYEPGARCSRCAEVGGSGVVSGWVLGGRKFQTEHEHVTNFDPSVYDAVEVEPPVTDEDDAGAALEAN